MQSHHRPQLIHDLSVTALGLIEEAELKDPQEARALVELAGTLDRLRVQMISESGTVPPLLSSPEWLSDKQH